MPGAYPVIYQAFITPPSGPKFQLTNTFNIGVFPADAPILHPEVVIPQQVLAPYGPVSGGSATAVYYTYYESADGQLVDPRQIAWFVAGGLPEGNYTIEIDGFAWDGSMYQPMAPQSKTFYVYNGYIPGGNAPQCTLNLTSAADCGNITVGQTITGEYSVTDEFFGIVTVAMTPLSGITMPTVILSNFNDGPESVVYDGTNTAGTSGTFTIDTSGLPPCGYTIQLQAWDRALANSCEGPNCTGHYGQAAQGFCLVAPTD